MQIWSCPSPTVVPHGFQHEVQLLATSLCLLSCPCLLLSYHGSNVSCLSATHEPFPLCNSWTSLQFLIISPSKLSFGFTWRARLGQNPCFLLSQHPVHTLTPHVLHCTDWFTCLADRSQICPFNWSIFSPAAQSFSPCLAQFLGHNTCWINAKWVNQGWDMVWL